MEIKTYKTAKGIEKKKFVVTQEEYESLSESYQGICLECGEVRDNCEPDAEKYECESCGELKVYGAEQMLIMGRLEIKEE